MRNGDGVSKLGMRNQVWLSGPIWAYLGLALIAIWSSKPAMSQVQYGSLVGNVTDASNAPVPEAPVKITHVETNQTRTGATNAEGVFNFPTIQAGTYEIVVSKPGFQTFVQRNVAVTINTVVRIDASLQIGSLTETVQVDAQAAVLQTDRAEVRSEMTSNQLENLPVPPGRNYEQLYATLPGFQPPANYGPLSQNPSRTLAFAVNGASKNSVGFTIDGSSARSVFMRGSAAMAPALDAIETVNVVTNSMDAEQGVAGSAAISVSIKSGTNQVHGSAFEYHTDNVLTARPVFLPGNQGKPKFVQNEFGGSVGGPIKRNKLFYFVSYDGTFEARLADNSATLFTIPTAAIRSGDMSGSTTPIYDPLTGTPDGKGRTPFARNIIPLDRQSPIVTQKILPLLPLPNYTGLTSNFYSSGKEHNHRGQIDAKMNYHASDKLIVSARIGNNSAYTFSDSAFGNDGLQGPPLYSAAWIQGESTAGFWNSSANAVYQFKPTFILDTSIGFTLEDYNMVPPNATTQIGTNYLGIPGANGPRPQDAGWPIFSVANYANMGLGQNDVPFYAHDPQVSYVANLNWMKGTHNIRFGGETHREHMNHWEPYSAVSTFTFNGNMTSLNGGAGPNQYNTFADFLLGTASGMSKFLPWGEITTRVWFHRLYIRDQWQASRKLTVSYGLGWEYYPPATRADRGMELYNSNDNTLAICGVGGTPTDCGLKTSKHLFAPRLGIAFRPSDTFVIRAGYGISYDTWSVARDVSYVYPVRGTYTAPAANSYTPAGTLATGIPPQSPPDLSAGVIPMPLAISTATPTNPYVRPYIQSFNFTMQKQLKGDGPRRPATWPLEPFTAPVSRT